MEIIIEPWKQLVIHEVLEQKFEDWLTHIIAGARAAGGGIPTIFWAGGIAFHFATFPDTESHSSGEAERGEFIIHQLHLQSKKNLTSK